MSGSWWTPRRLAACAGLAAFLSVVATLGDPGITVDEPLDVRPGRNYVRLLLRRGAGILSAESAVAMYADNKEHPPLGRWLLGIASTVGEPFEIVILGRDPFSNYLLSGRLAPAAAFGLLVGLVTAHVSRRRGRAAGLVAGLSIVLMPRVFAHAHLGALDTFVALSWTWSVLSAAEAVESPRPARGMALAGVVWGLALLTKIHGWLLPPVVIVYACVRSPWRPAMSMLTAWLGVGLVVFVAGWPWLWHDPSRLADYLRTGVERLSIRVLYFGHIYADRHVPWHFAPFYFLATVPVGLHALGVVGAVRAWRERRADPTGMMMLAAPVWLLFVFTAVAPVYDGERLFLPVFPLWACSIGAGFGVLWSRIGTWTGRKRALGRVAMVMLTLGQGVGLLSVHPFGLSYYNALVGGLPGAERLGLELTFWGDAADPVLQRRLAALAPPESPVALAPTLAPNQGPFSTDRSLFARSMVLRDQESLPASRYAVIHRRSAYWSPEVAALTRTRPLILRTRQGVWLSGVWKVPDKNR